MRRTRSVAYRMAGLGALVGLIAVVYGRGNIGYDAAYSVVWGDELRHLDVPDFGAHLSPTPHPLANLVGALAALFGIHAFAIVLALSRVAFAGLAWAAFELGSRVFTRGAGVVFAALLVSRPILVAEMLQGSTDIPFLALVLAALAVELRERRPVLVLGLLLAAGLLRPEAWLLSASYLAWIWSRIAPGQRRRLAALALAGPGVWFAIDLALTGNPFHSLSATQSLAIALQRPVGFANAARDLPQYLSSIVGSAVVWCGLVSCAVTIWVIHERVRTPAIVLGAGFAAFLALGLFRLPLLDRYVLIPAAMLALFAAGGVSAWSLLPVGTRWRWLAAAGSAAAAIALAASAPGTRSDLSHTLAAGSATRHVQDDFQALIARAAAKGWLRRCGLPQVPTYRVVPLLAYWLDARPSQVPVVAPTAATHGLLVSAPFTTLENDRGLYPLLLGPARLRIPPGFRPIAANRSWTLAEHC